MKILARFEIEDPELDEDEIQDALDQAARALGAEVVQWTFGKDKREYE